MASASSETRIDPDGWTAALADVDGPQLVVAGPGAGKTEFLVRRALHLIVDRGVSPEQVLLLSFSRRGAFDMRSRIVAGLNRSFTTIAASTFHSFAFRLLEAHGPWRRSKQAMPTLLTGPEQVALVGRLLGDESPTSWPMSLRGLLGTHTLAEEVADFLLRCHENMIGPVDLAGRPEWRAIPSFLNRYRSELVSANRIDYGTLQSEAVSLLEDPAIRQQVADQYPYLLVDEYQDTTVAQAHLLRRLYLPHRNLTVAGDPYQSIFSFRGANLTNIADFPESFPDATGGPARRWVLTTSFRVPAEILAAAVRLTAAGGLPGEAGPVAPAPGRGSVEVYGFDQRTHEAEWIASEVQRIHLRDATPYSRVAVLMRSKRPFLSEVSRALERRGIPHDLPDRRLVDHPAVRIVLDCVRVATTSGAFQLEALRRLLLGPLVALPLSAMRELERHQARTGDPWPDVLSHRVPGGDALASMMEDGSWAADRPAADGFWRLWSTLPQFGEAVHSRRRATDRAAWSSLAQVLQRLGERDPSATLAEYLRWSEADDFEATPLLEYAGASEDRLTLTTLHQAKGVDFDVVFIADSIDGVLPDLRSRDSLLGARHLSSGSSGDPTSWARFRLQEEMRLAYTAMCRACTRVVWTCTPGRFEEGRGLPSRFLAMVAATESAADALGRPEEPREPSTPVEAEAWLRRTMRDPNLPTPHRLAALASLAGKGGWRTRPPSEFAGALERGSDRGLIPEHLTLSPSQADQYLQCPRLYVLRRRLQADDEGSLPLSFGSLIHEVLEQVEREALLVERAHGSLADAMAALGRLWDPRAFGGGEWARAWQRRAERVLTHLYEAWPSAGRVVALEHPLELVVEGTLWRGRSDRIEVTIDAEPQVRVIDYKTSTTALSKERAATSVQLGFYVLAASADPTIANLGKMGTAEFWYPAVPNKSVARRTFDPDRIGEVKGLMAAAEAGIRSENWEPVPGDHCRSCPVRLVCPEWPEGREAFSE
jgi:superfamily I DNA/RNA helicase/CRISPR/Cas system-associated exonuclease Cas4 (RecB family)